MNIQSQQRTLLKVKLFRGFSDPSRLAILEALSSGPLTVGALVERTGLSQPNVSNHLASLRDSGLVLSSQQGRYISYQLSHQQVALLLDLAEELLADSMVDMHISARSESVQLYEREVIMDEEQDPDNIEQSMHDLEQPPLLSLEQEQQLIQTLQQGKAAQQQLIEAHRLLVVSIALSYGELGLHLADLIEAGNDGLVRAAEKFDASKQYRFTTYATWWIRQAITRALTRTK